MEIKRFISLNLDKVLINIPNQFLNQPFQFSGYKINLCSQGEALQIPVTTEALILLYSLIKQDAYADNRMSK
jgi:hypothetical protein